jgi:O-antigen ligase
MWRPSRLTEILLLLVLFTITFEKIHWSVYDVLTALFLASFLADRVARGDARLPRPAATAVLFFGAFLLVYLVGFYNLETLPVQQEALSHFAKGLTKFVLHFGLLLAGAAVVARRSERFYWYVLGALVLGMAANAGYGVVQLLAARAGFNLDQAVLSPLTGGASQINIYGSVEGEAIYRTNALTGDPHHLAIMLLVPLLALAPVYLRLEPGHRLRVPMAVLLAFLLLVFLSTLSRSGALGLAVGVAVLAIPYRRLLLSRTALVPLSVVGVLVAYVVYRRLDFYEAVLRSRLQTSDPSSSLHFDVYGFIPDILAARPLFGLGLNNFEVYYEFVTGKVDWGPHSFYVAVLVETGLVGTALFAVFLWWLFRQLAAARAVDRALALARDPLAARVRPLAWGLTAALAGTLAANLFYLTMTFYYFYALALLAVTAPLVFSRRLEAGA